MAESSTEIQTYDAVRVVDQAIEALGGAGARKLLRRGKVEMTFTGQIPGVDANRGSRRLVCTFELPDYDRRDIYPDSDEPRTILITNSGTLWMGNDQGIGRSQPARSPELSHGPLLVGMMQSVLQLRDDASGLRLGESGASADTHVVEAYAGGELSSRVYFDHVTHLPVRIEKPYWGLQSDTLEEPTETVTTFDDYRQFGSATLPTRVTVQQDGVEIMTITLNSADFDSPIDRSVFAIPDSRMPSTFD